MELGWVKEWLAYAATLSGVATVLGWVAVGMSMTRLGVGSLVISKETIAASGVLFLISMTPMLSFLAQLRRTGRAGPNVASDLGNLMSTGLPFLLAIYVTANGTLLRAHPIQLAFLAGHWALQMLPTVAFVAIICYALKAGSLTPGSQITFLSGFLVVHTVLFASTVVPTRSALFGGYVLLPTKITVEGDEPVDATLLAITETGVVFDDKDLFEIAGDSFYFDVTSRKTIRLVNPDKVLEIEKVAAPATE